MFEYLVIEYWSLEFDYWYQFRTLKNVCSVGPRGRISGSKSYRSCLLTGIKPFTTRHIFSFFKALTCYDY